MSMFWKLDSVGGKSGKLFIFALSTVKKFLNIDMQNGVT